MQRGDGPDRGRLRLVAWLGAACLMAAPALAMILTDEMDWGLEDFAIFSAMLLAACGLWELALRLSESRPLRAAAGLAIIALFGLVWVHLAVGLF